MDVELVKIDEMEKIIEYAYYPLPDFAVEGKMKSIRHVPSIDKIKKCVKKKSLILYLHYQILGLLFFV